MKNKNAADAKKSQQTTNIKRLVLTAVLIGLATALSLIKFWKMPLGGSVTLLSMLPIALIAIEYGVGWGLVGSFAYSIIQMLLDLPEVLGWGLTPTMLVGTIALDYILAFTAIGLSGLFRKKGVPGICIGIGIALFLRFVFHLLSGTIIFAEWMPEGWANPVLYSVCYNGAFMLPELVMTMAGAVALFKIPGFNKLVSGNIES